MLHNKIILLANATPVKIQLIYSVFQWASPEIAEIVNSFYSYFTMETIIIIFFKK